MPSNKIHLGDIGVVFRVTINDIDQNGVEFAVDLSAATTQEFIFEKPDESQFTVTTSFTTDGTDGQIQYISVADDLDDVGNWCLQAHIIIPAGEFRSSIVRFPVEENL